MNSIITIDEKFSRYWVQTTIALALLTIIFWGVYTNFDDVLWKGIFRLAAFVALAGTVLSGLKLIEGKHTITLETKDGHLLLNYNQKAKKKGEDLFELNNISSLWVDHHFSLFDEAFIFNDVHVMIELKDSDRPLNLIELGGRPLALTKENAAKIIQFIKQHTPHVNIPEQYREYLEIK